MNSENTWLLYVVVLLVLWTAFALLRRRASHKARARQTQAIADGLGEPASLHPVIDPNKCLGCGACVSACPEGDILGLIDGKAQLVEPSHCIGHGACKAACPFDAISLVFGTETRGVDIPLLQPNFETDVPGVFIAGELGGMGLIKNAVEQGVQAAEAVSIYLKNQPSKQADTLDLVIVGAGPAGIAASLYCQQKKLSFVTLEQDSLGGTVAHFPRNKIVMTAPVNLPIVGKVKLRETSKEALLSLWQGVIDKTQIPVHFSERVSEVNPLVDGFVVQTEGNRYQARSVILCMGRRGTPRTLGVPGESHNKVVYRLIDPEQYQGQHVLVVGGGDSALEAACALAEQHNTTVTLSYRSAAFSRAKLKNREWVDAKQASGELQVLLESEVLSISEDTVELRHAGTTLQLANDAVIVCAGGILPTAFLQHIGITVEKKHGSS